MSGKVRANFNIDCSVLSHAELEAFKAACQAFHKYWKSSGFKITQNELLVKELGPESKAISRSRHELMFC